MITRDWTMEDVAYGVEHRGVYDGVVIWVLKDGREVNRWEGIPGYEHLAEKVNEILERRSGDAE